MTAATHKRYAMVYDEAVTSIVSEPTSTCTRLPNEHNKHRHFCIIQIEIDEDGLMFDMGVTKGLHSAEVREVMKELTAQGVQFHLAGGIDKRIEDAKQAKILMLRRQAIGDAGNEVPWYWVDVCDSSSKSLIMGLGQYDDTPQGYTRALRHIQAKAGDLNLPFVDTIASQVLAPKGDA